MTENLDDIQLAEPAFWKRPDKFDMLARFRRERPIAKQHLPDCEGYYWSLTRHKETCEITKNAKLFLSHYGTGMSCLDSPELAYDIAGMVNRDGPAHRRLRRVVSKVFTPGRLKALEEIVRYVTPVVQFGRTAARDTEILGQPIAAGEQVVFWYVSANRDEIVFDEPEQFDIRRTPNDHVAYGGGGPHQCLGMHLARREMYHFFNVLFETLPDLEIDLNGMQSLDGLFIRGMHHLPCRFTPVRMDA